VAEAYCIAEERMSQIKQQAGEIFRHLVHEGREQGHEEGRAQGRAEGRDEGTAEAILEVLAVRGIDLPHATVERIRGCRDTALLDRWLARAMRLESPGEAELMTQAHLYQSELFLRLMHQGRAEGRAEGLQAGRLEGRRRAVAEAILEVLAGRGIAVPGAVADRIRACDDLATLQAWLARAVRVAHAEEVVR